MSLLSGHAGINPPPHLEVEAKQSVFPPGASPSFIGPIGAGHASKELRVHYLYFSREHIFRISCPHHQKMLHLETSNTLWQCSTLLAAISH